MTKSTRRINPISSTPKTNATTGEAEPAFTSLHQTGNVEANHQIDPTCADFIDRQKIALDPNDLFIVNTDDRTPSLPGRGLIATRQNRMSAILGKQAELVSIVVQAYNRLEKTKLCVESILKYTAEFEYELVLYDNGSTDETLEYFESVQHPRKKIIRFTQNVGNHLPFIFNQLSGRYLAFICGDIYVTRNWLKNLLTCLKSEADTGLVVPVFSNANNLQGADITFDTLDEMQAKAAQHNISDPALWHARLRLINPMSLYKREVLEVVGMVDYGFFHDGSDNDLTFRVRRAGYKTVLCKDTFVHHDHVRINLSDKNREQLDCSLESGRKDFKNKYYGIDAWDDVNNYETLMMSLVNPQKCQGSKRIEILGVDVLCGTPILELKNKLREAQVYDARLSAFSTDPKYWLDLKTICAGDVAVDRIEHIKEHFSDEQFDYIVLGKPINSYQNRWELLLYLLKRLKNDGHLLLKLRNTFDILSLFKTLGANINVNTNNVYQLSMDELFTQMKNTGFVPKKIAVENWPLDEKNLQFLRNAIASTSFNLDPAEVFARAVVMDYVIDIARE